MPGEKGSMLLLSMVFALANVFLVHVLVLLVLKAEHWLTQSVAIVLSSESTGVYTGLQQYI